MAFSGSSLDFLGSLKLGKDYVKTQNEYINSLHDLAGSVETKQGDTIDETQEEIGENTMWGILFGIGQAVAGAVAAPFTGGATIPVAVDGLRRVISSAVEGQSQQEKYKRQKGQLTDIGSKYGKQIKALSANFKIQEANYEQALYNTGKELRLVEIRLDKESQRLKDTFQQGNLRISRQRVGIGQNLDILKNSFSNFETRNNIAIRKANDEFTTYFKSFVDETSVLSGYKQAAMDSAESADFFTGLEVSQASQKGLTSLERGAATESSESGANRRLNNAAKVLTELNLAQDKAFQQQQKTNQSLINSLLNIRSKETSLKTTLDLRAIGLRSQSQTLEADLLTKLKETEIKENYFNNLLGYLDQENTALNSRFIQGTSVLEKTYAIAVESAKKTADTINKKAFANLEQSFNTLGSRIEGSLNPVSFPTSNLGSTFGDILGKIGPTLDLLNQTDLANNSNELQRIENLISNPSLEQYNQRFSSPSQAEQSFFQGRLNA